MKFPAHWHEFYATALFVSLLMILQVSGLTTQLPSSQVAGDTQKNTHRTLVLESSELVLNPSRHRVPGPELQPTPEINELQTPTTTHLSHQPLPSSDYFPFYDDTVSPSTHAATERLDISSRNTLDSEKTTNDSELSSVPSPSSSRHRVARASSSFHAPLLPTSSTQEATHPWQQLLMTNYPSFMENRSVVFPLLPMVEDDHRKLLMLVLRTEDCHRFNKEDFEDMLTNLLEKYGYEDAVPQVSTARCHTHLTITVTLNSSVPTLRFIPNVESKSNVTVDVLNRTFRVVRLEKVDLRLQRKKQNSNNEVIASISTHESVAYLALGVCFGLTLLVCCAICFFKLCCGPDPAPRRRLRKQYPRTERLGPDDYVLRPLPKASTSSSHRTRYPRILKYKEADAAFRISPFDPIKEEGVVSTSDPDASVIPMEDIDGAEVTSKDSNATDSRSAPRGLQTELNNFKNIGKVSPAEGVSNPTFERY